MRINFILPFFLKKAGGGSKIMYEYARRLSERGHEVVIYHTIRTPFTSETLISKDKAISEYRRLCFF